MVGETTYRPTKIKSAGFHIPERTVRICPVVLHSAFLVSHEIMRMFVYVALLFLCVALPTISYFLVLIDFA